MCRSILLHYRRAPPQHARASEPKAHHGLEETLIIDLAREGFYLSAHFLSEAPDTSSVPCKCPWELMSATPTTRGSPYAVLNKMWAPKQRLISTKRSLLRAVYK